MIGNVQPLYPMQSTVPLTPVSIPVSSQPIPFTLHQQPVATVSQTVPLMLPPQPVAVPLQPQASFVTSQPQTPFMTPQPQIPFTTSQSIPVAQTVVQEKLPLTIQTNTTTAPFQTTRIISATPWKLKFPAIISSIFALVEFVVALVIIGCEIGSILIDMVTATIYVGLWSGLVFLLASTSQGIASTCCRNRTFASYALVAQIVALIFAICVIGFDAYFIAYPGTCFFPASTCIGTGSLRGVFFSVWNFENVKMSLIKAQLSVACLMFILCLIYIAIYGITSIRVYQRRTAPATYSQMQTTSYTTSTIPTGPDGLLVAPPVYNIRPARAMSPLYHRPTIVIDGGDGRSNDLLCPTCNTTMNVTVRKRPPQ